MKNSLFTILGGLAILAGSARADLTLGVKPNTYAGPGYGTFDTYAYSLFAYQQVPAVNASDDVLSSWSFYSLTNNPVAPVIYSGSLTSGAGNLKVVWIGAAVTPVGHAGVYTYKITGAPTLVAGEYLGWQDLGPNGSAGNIAFSGEGYGTGPDGSGISYDNSVGGPASAMTSYLFTDASTDVRNYYADFTLTPEPMYYGLLAVGLALLFIFRRFARVG
jgi:hypothetical protein